MTNIHIKEQWNRLDPTTQQWLMDNPGCVVLPRTLTAIFNKETSENADVDMHGEAVLTDEDREFILVKAREAEATGGRADYRFFDSAQP
ncbi:hypothetical protein [Arthrobacter sp. ES3-54]|uniref:hypothetical protein n=1 Tax=Arthrobacter sp. ES3-54 TaxID=1502991 RepID=UPI00321628E5|nr:hypothetical protein [Arthrobacter sp. ES3-54]